MTTKSTQEAISLLENSRPLMIEKAREVAIDFILKNGEVTSRDVWAAMKERGLLNEELPGFWLGAVFRAPYFKWTGRYFTYSDPERNIHERTVKIWTSTPEKDLDERTGP